MLNQIRHVTMLCGVALGVLPTSPASAHPGSGIAVDAQGEVYFVHTGVGVFKVDGNGHLSRYAGPGFHFMILDPENGFVSQRWPRFPDGEIRTAGTTPKLLLASSFPLTIGPDGALYYPHAQNDDRVHVMRLRSGGQAVTFAVLPVMTEIGADGKRGPARWIHGLAAGRDGTLYYAEQNAVRRIGSDGSVSLVAGDFTIADCRPPSAGFEERHRAALRGLDVAADGTIYVAASGCSAVLRITPAGAVSVVLRASDSWSPTGVAVAGTDLYVLEFRYIEVERAEDWLPRIRKVAQDGTPTVIATMQEQTR